MDLNDLKKHKTFFLIAQAACPRISMEAKSLGEKERVSNANSANSDRWAGSGDTLWLSHLRGTSEGSVSLLLHPPAPVLSLSLTDAPLQSNNTTLFSLWKHTSSCFSPTTTASYSLTHSCITLHCTYNMLTVPYSPVTSHFVTRCSKYKECSFSIKWENYSRWTLDIHQTAHCAARGILAHLFIWFDDNVITSRWQAPNSLNRQQCLLSFMGNIHMKISVARMHGASVEQTRWPMVMAKDSSLCCAFVCYTNMSMTLCPYRQQSSH